MGLMLDASGKVEAPLAIVTRAGTSPSGVVILMTGPLIPSAQWIRKGGKGGKMEERLTVGLRSRCVRNETTLEALISLILNRASCMEQK
jgi:hypothetical protein